MTSKFEVTLAFVTVHISLTHKSQNKRKEFSSLQVFNVDLVPRNTQVRENAKHSRVEGWLSCDRKDQTALIP